MKERCVSKRLLHTYFLFVQKTHTIEECKFNLIKWELSFSQFEGSMAMIVLITGRSFFLKDLLGYVAFLIMFVIITDH